MAKDVTTVPGYPTRTTYSSWPYILSMIGGVLVLIEGIIIAAAGPLIMVIGGDFGLGTLVFGIFVVILGAIIIWLAYALRQRPAQHVAYGAGIIIVSVIALVFAGGGFVIGSLLGIIGGAWAIMRA
jgi:uncharacterized membrane protein YvlD (DUF360 family)